VTGNTVSYCNGKTWDRPLGWCRHRNYSQSHTCDFESKDLGGWSFSKRWYWASTVGNYHSDLTGPQLDHTLQNEYEGHYMLLETSPYANGLQHLISPKYSKELSLKNWCCFRFHYYMYGSGVGSLVVSVKPDQMGLDEMWKNNRLYV